MYESVNLFLFVFYYLDNKCKILVYRTQLLTFFFLPIMRGLHWLYHLFFFQFLLFY